MSAAGGATTLAMSISVTFLGAARNVTGSRYLVRCGSAQVLVDCGLYQERELLHRNWEGVPFRPGELDAILLTHAHLDHSGFVPVLAREGFGGPVYCTEATAEIVRILLPDAGRLNEEDAEHKRRRHERERRKGRFPEKPLYTEEDARRCLGLLSPVRYGERVSVGGDLEAVFREAGHILGSSSICLRSRGGGAGEGASLVFSGDLGGPGRPILRDPEPPCDSGCVVIESTYGDRLHGDARDVGSELARIVNATVEAGGNLVIPSFAVERAHELLYYLSALLEEDRIPHLMVFVDSPMAVSVTEVFERHAELFDEEMLARMRSRRSPFEFPGLRFVSSVEDSKAINRIRGSAIIIAGSGMCTGGRIKHHLARNLPRAESTILFVGYQAAGTLGRQIADGAREVRIFGETVPVRSRVERLEGLSAHADRNGLLRWLESSGRRPERVFVTHGEPAAADSFAALARERLGCEATVPAYGDTVVVD